LRRFDLAHGAQRSNLLADQTDGSFDDWDAGKYATSSRLIS
jgi:hypothetical protein